MRFEWDEDRLNRRKHGGIGFEFASRVSADGRCLIIPDRDDRETGEPRWHAVGRVGGFAVYAVLHAYREGADGEEVIRIISARWAEKHEGRRYFQQAVH
jgi:uncharacterized DUF497 family protein